MKSFRHQTIPRALAVLLILLFPLTAVFAATASSSPVHSKAREASPTFEEPVSAHASSSIPNEVALTFDDGPYGTSTLEILSILRAEHVHATFFLVGKNVEKYPDIARLIVADGNMIGNHTYDHPGNLARRSKAGIEAELTMADAAIASTTGIHPKLFRPPYDRSSKRLRNILAARGYRTVLWNVDPADWDYGSSTSAVIEERIKAQQKPQMTIVMHDGRDTHIDYPRDNTITALPVIIERLEKEGYVFVTADKLPF